MSKSKLNSLFSLPFLHTYNTGTRKFITISKVQTFLGSNFYTRLAHIYDNLIDAFVNKNYRVLQSYFERGLMDKIRKQLVYIEEGQMKFKIHQPDIKPTVKKWKILRKTIPVRDSIWESEGTKIGIQCRVFFGQKFTRQDPLKIQEIQKYKIYYAGQFRHIRYYPNLSILQNIKNMYNEQTYELNITYSSKKYLQIQHYDEITTKSMNRSNNIEPQNQIITEIIMRTGNTKFDWVIVDINKINQICTTKVQHKNNSNPPSQKEDIKQIDSTDKKL